MTDSASNPDFSEPRKDASAMSDPQIRSKDLSEPEFDALVKEGLENVPVPDGLKSRLLAAVQAEAESETLGQTSPQLEEQPVVLEGDAKSNRDDKSSLNVVGKKPTEPKSHRRWFGAALVAASALLLVTLPMLRSTVDARALADQGIAWFEAQQPTQQPWQEEQLGDDDLFELSTQIRLAGLQLRGVRDVTAAELKAEGLRLACESGRAWNFDRHGESFYVLRLRGAANTEGLSEQLRIIQASGAWSIAARRIGDEVLLIAARHDVSRYLRSAA